MRDPIVSSPRPSRRVLGPDAALLIAGRLSSAVCGLVQVPIALAHLGADRFGVWIALTGLIWMGGSLDGGVGFALQNRLAALVARGREGEARGMVRHGFRLLWLIAAGLAAVGAGLVAWGDWADWFGIADPVLAGEVRPAMAIVIAAMALAVPCSLGMRLATAMQQTGLIGWWTGVASILGLAAVVAARSLGFSLVGFTLVACLLPLIPPVAAGLQVLRRCAWLREKDATFTLQPGLGRESAMFFVPQLGAVFMSSFVPTLVAFFAGPIATAAYGVLQRLFGLVLQLQSLALQPTWPAYTHAAAKGDAGTARRVYFASMIGALVCAVALLLIVPFARDILRLWLGPRVPDISSALLWTMAAWHVAQCLGQPPAMLLNGAGRAAVVAGTSVAGIVVSLLASAWLGPLWGAVGVIAALGAPYVLLNLPVVMWQAARTLTLIARSPTA